MFGIEGIEAMELGSGILGLEPPVDGDLGRVALGNRGPDFPPQRVFIGSRCFRQERTSTLNSISAMFNQLPCLGV